MAGGGITTEEMLNRPQEALLAEGSRLLHAVLAMTGEGEPSPTALNRGLQAFGTAKSHPRCQASVLANEWWERVQLLNYFADKQMRTAYDCAPKRFRAQFLCALNRNVLAEAKRNQDCVRGSWQNVMGQFPEINIWRELRERLKTKVWTPLSSVEEESNVPLEAEDKKEKKSKWDASKEDVAEKQQPGAWGRKWRQRIKRCLPRSLDEAVPICDAEVLQLCCALWKEFTDEIRAEGSMQMHLDLFAADPSERSYVRRGSIDPREGPLEWAYVPATDILLVVGDPFVGVTAEGLSSENPVGHERWTWKQILDNNPPPRRKTKSPSRKRSRSKPKEDAKAKNDPNFDWEREWRARMQRTRRASPEPRERERRRRSGSRERDRRRRRREERDAE
eukprot:TRINITY_DN21219_c0_g1_i5.p1 TRINITY_DN21219_c0_g1~~TRINITY_DN21219_c0_g1_i5.p1  ORF type:complete len:391 (-),score=96.19 TRINITY_DN21219_c0_g1_i5:246-1418(-)